MAGSMRDDPLAAGEDIHQSLRRCGVAVPPEWSSGTRYVRDELHAMAVLLRQSRPPETEPAFLFDVLTICRHHPGNR